MIVATTIPEVNDIMDDSNLRELWIVCKEMERPPYWFADEGMGNRLSKAIRRVQDEQVTPREDGAYTVTGSGTRAYVVRGRTCECPASQKGKTSWWYHRVSVALYVEWQRRLRPMAPVALGTLRAGTAPLPSGPTPEDTDDLLGNGFPVDDETLPLPLPPVTVDERLAAPGAQEPLGARMSADVYIPEPDTADAPVTVLDATDADFPPLGPAPTRPLPGPVLLPSLDAQTLEQSMQAWSAQRQVVKRFLQQELVEGTDYYTLRIGGKVTKPALSKAGSEKFMALFQLHATFSQDSATWTMLGTPQGTLCYVCHLHTRGGELIGEGRGARKLQQDNGDINKAVKMAQKSAMVDAILRTGALSDVFTQDLEDQPEAPPAPAAKPVGQSQDLRSRIWKLVQAHAPEVKSREAVEAYIQQQTGMALHPDLYQAIVARLEDK